jgi:hypothetical protein
MIATSDADHRTEDANAELGKLSILEQALIEGCTDPLVQRYLVLLTRSADERARIYGQELPIVTPQDIRHTRAVHKEIDRLTDGESSSLHASSPADWNRLKLIAEQNLGKER